MGEKFRFHPYTWNHEKKYPEVVSSTVQLSLWYAHVMIVFCYYGFLWWRCIMVNMSEETKSSQKIYMQFVLTLYTIPVIIQTTIIFRRDDFPQFIKNYLEFAEIFQGMSSTCQDNPAFCFTKQIYGDLQNVLCWPMRQDLAYWRSCASISSADVSMPFHSMEFCLHSPPPCVLGLLSCSHRCWKIRS